MNFDVNLKKKMVLEPQSHLGGYPLKKALGLGDSYLIKPHNLVVKKLLIQFFDKISLKPRGKFRKSLRSIFISIICRHNIENRTYIKKMQKNYFEFYIMAYPALQKNLLGIIMNVQNELLYKKSLKLQWSAKYHNYIKATN